MSHKKPPYEEITKTTKKDVAFLVFFLLSIFCVGIHQAWYELYSEEYKENPEKRIQIFDLPKDMFLTPFQKRAEQDSLIKVIQGTLDSMHKVADEQDRLMLAEELEYQIGDLERSFLNPNRHVVLELPLKTQHALLMDSRAFLKDYNGGMNSLIQFQEDLHHHTQHVRQSAWKLLVNGIFKHTLFSRSYLRKYEAEMEDESQAAIHSRPVIQYWRWEIFKDPGEKAVTGKGKGADDWLFYKPGVDYLVRPWVDDPRAKTVDANDKAMSDSPLDTIETFKEQLDKLGVELLVVIVPAKPSIYPEKVSRSMNAAQAGRFSHSLAVMDSLKARGIDVVDLFGPFAEERTKDAQTGDNLYLKTDTHWKLRGLKRAAAEVAEAVQKKSWYSDSNAVKREYVLEADTVLRIGDVSQMSQLEKLKDAGWPVEVLEESTPAEKVVQVIRKEEDSTSSKRPFKFDFRKSRILVIGDSFSRIYQTDAPRNAGWISHLAYNLQEPVGAIISDGGASTLVRQKLARKKKVLKGKKLLIWEFVERDFRFGAEGWKNVSLD